MVFSSVSAGEITGLSKAQSETILAGERSAGRGADRRALGLQPQ